MMIQTARRGFPAGRRFFSNVTGMEKAVLVRGGTVVNADYEFKADVLSIGEKIVQVAPNIEPPTGLDLTTIEADGCYVMPGGIDPQTHMEIPFMGAPLPVGSAM